MFTYSLTFLLPACRYGHVDTVVLLLENQADVSICNKYGYTALICACFEGHLSLVKLLLQYKAHVDARNNYGNTGLMIACKNNHLDIVKYLHQNSGNIHLKNTHGDTALTLACNEGNIEIARFLLTNGINVNECNNYGDSAIGLACYSGHIPLIKLLLDYGADIYNRNAKGKNGIDYLTKDKKSEILAYIKSLNYLSTAAPARTTVAAPEFSEEPKLFSLFNSPEVDVLKTTFSSLNSSSNFHLPPLDWFLETKEVAVQGTSKEAASVPVPTGSSEVAVWLESLGLGEYSPLLSDAGAFTIPLKEFILIFESVDFAGANDDEIDAIIPKFKSTFKPMHKMVFKRKIKELLSAYEAAGTGR